MKRFILLTALACLLCDNAYAGSKTVSRPATKMTWSKPKPEAPRPAPVLAAPAPTVVHVNNGGSGLLPLAAGVAIGAAVTPNHAAAAAPAPVAIPGKVVATIPCPRYNANHQKCRYDKPGLFAGSEDLEPAEYVRRVAGPTAELVAIDGANRVLHYAVPTK